VGRHLRGTTAPTLNDFLPRFIADYCVVNHIQRSEWRGKVGKPKGG
jgi:hypothetical protein